MNPTIKIVILSIDEKRMAYMKQQFLDLNITIPVEIFIGCTPSTSVNYIKEFDKKIPELHGTICCFRSYAALFDHYKNDESEYLIVAEDDISITQNNFIQHVYELIDTWKKYEHIEYISLGFNLNCLYDTIKKYKHDQKLYHDMYMFADLWGAQLTIFKPQTVIKLAGILHHETTTIAREQILSQKVTYARKYMRLQIDAILPLLCKYGINYPPLAVENNIFQSTIHGNDNSQEKFFTLHPYINFSDFYMLNIQNHPKTGKIIGIYLNDTNEDIFSFVELISSLGYDIYLITDRKISGYKNVVYEPDLCEKIKFNLVFEIGVSLPIEFVTNLREIGCKIVLYKYMNETISHSEQVIFSKNIVDFKNIKSFDQIWCSSHCSTYYKILFNRDIINVPFIWSTSLTDTETKLLQNRGFYKPKLEMKKIIIFEQNTSSSNYALPAVFVIENYYRDTPNLKISNVYVTNIGDKNLAFSNMLRHLELHLDKKITMENLNPTIHSMVNYADIVMSCDNSLIFKMAWMGWPILHNSKEFRNIGYYYDNIEHGGKILKEIIDIHDSIIDYYIAKNRDEIKKYLSSNIKNQKLYGDLINDLLA